MQKTVDTDYQDILTSLVDEFLDDNSIETLEE